jgi:crossover junction endodeoxyribonuclease RuvC
MALSGDTAVVPAGPRTTPRVVGVDPSLTATGVASSDGWCSLIGKDGVTTLPLDARLSAVDGLVERIITEIGRPDLVLIELPAFSRAVGGALERHALWWLLVRRIRRAELPLAIVYTRGRMRYATGKGAAKKTEIVDAVARRLPMFATGGDDNMADAAVMCAMGADWLGHPLAKMPEANRKALDAVEWPELVGGATCRP